MKNTFIIGQRGESIAEEYLTANGVEIIEKNFRTRYGEIDLIGFDNGTLVIFEVRAKKNEESGEPIEMVHYKKQQKVLKMTKWYIAEKKYQDDVRIDAVGITLTSPPRINWVKNAIEDNY